VAEKLYAGQNTQQKVSLLKLFNLISIFPVVSDREWTVKSKFDVCQQYPTLPKLEAYFQAPKFLERLQPPNVAS